MPCNPNVKYTEVTLTEFEQMYYAPIWAYRRWIEAEIEGRQHRADFRGDGLEIHLWGILGEIAYAKAHNLYYIPTVNTFKAPDIDGIQVRTALGHGRRLIIRPGDKDSEYFALVTVDKRTPKYLRVYGGMVADEAKAHPEWLEEYNGRERAWFVPQAALYGRVGVAV